MWRSIEVRFSEKIQKLSAESLFSTKTDLSWMLAIFDVEEKWVESKMVAEGELCG